MFKISGQAVGLWDKKLLLQLNGLFSVHYWGIYFIDFYSNRISPSGSCHIFIYEAPPWAIALV